MGAGGRLGPASAFSTAGGGGAALVLLGQHVRSHTQACCKHVLNPLHCCPWPLLPARRTSTVPSAPCCGLATNCRTASWWAWCRCRRSTSRRCSGTCRAGARGVGQGRAATRCPAPSRLPCGPTPSTPATRRRRWCRCPRAPSGPRLASSSLGSERRELRLVDSKQHIKAASLPAHSLTEGTLSSS